MCDSKDKFLMLQHLRKVACLSLEQINNLKKEQNQTIENRWSQVKQNSGSTDDQDVKEKPKCHSTDSETADSQVPIKDKLIEVKDTTQPQDKVLIERSLSPFAL